MESRAMPEFEEARRIILEHVAALDAEQVELLDSLGRVLAEDVVARWALPSFTLKDEMLTVLGGVTGV